MKQGWLRHLVAIGLVFVASGALLADPALPKVRLSYQALDLTRPPTNLELVAAGQLGGALTPTHELADKAREAEVNLSFGHAIQLWNDHAYPQAVRLFKKHVKDYPDSPWAAEAILHLGCDATYQGRYHEARAYFDAILADHLRDADAGSRMMVHKTRQRLGNLEVLEYDFEAALEHYRLLKQESPDWRHRTYAAHWIQRIHRYLGAEADLLTCGIEALAHLLDLQGKTTQAGTVRDQLGLLTGGQSVAQILALAEAQGAPLSARAITTEELATIPLPAIVQLQRRSDGPLGHYWVVESVAGGRVHVRDPQSMRAFDQSIEEFGNEWQGIILLPSKGQELPGRPLAPEEISDIRGGCCGAPAAESPNGEPGDNGGGGDGGDPCGAPRWTVNMLSLNFYVVDVPMWYRTAYGPDVQFQLSYNSQSATAHHEPFGPKWQFNFSSYLIVDTGGSVLVFMPDGRRDQYNRYGPGNYEAPRGVHNRLVNVGPDAYELVLTDGTVYAYERPEAVSGEPLTQILLTEIRDTYNQSLSLAYDGEGQLISVTDATGQVSTLTYNGSGLVEQIADPFGRSVDLTYDGEGNLASIEDMGGYSSSFTYDADRYITSIDGARGRWEFYTEPSDEVPKWSDAYPPPGDPMWANYRITVTNPVGKRSEYFYYGGCEMGFGCRGTSWYVSPRDYITYRSQNHNNYDSGAPKTRYIPYDYPNGGGAIARIITPAGRDWKYTYDDDGNIEKITDSHGVETSYTYNTRGGVTSVTDRLDVVTEYVYAPNGFDIVEVRDTLGTTFYEYNAARDVTAITDRLGNRTELTYNGLGQPTSIKDALEVVTQYAYGAGFAAERVTRDGQIILERTFDARGRIASVTDDTGLRVSLAHDDLDRLTQRMYPGGVTEEFTYADCCLGRLETFSDRSGRVTRFSYDDLSRLVEAQLPDGAKSRYRYDPNGNLLEFWNRSGVAVTFEYDLDDRLARRIYADGSSESFEWDEEGWKDATVNGRGSRIEYSRNARGELTGVTFDDGTPNVSYVRDAAGRVTSRTDGLGSTSYVHDAESRLTEIDGPWTSDTVTLGYDALDRLTSVAVGGGDTTTYEYDSLNRLDRVLHGASVFDFSYSGASSLENSLTRPSGTTSSYTYHPLGFLEEITHRRAGSELISRYAYAFTPDGRRGTETIERSLASSSKDDGLEAHSYNDADQMLSSDTPARSYVYDLDGNLTQGYVPGGHPFTATYDAENHMTSLEWTDGSGQVHRRENSYDGDGWLARTVERLDGAVTKERRFIRESGWILQERNGSNGIVAEYSWDRRRPGGVGGLLQRRSPAGDHVYLADGRGNVSEVLDAAEVVVASYDYDPFGTITASGGTLEQDFRFSTKPFDSGTGLAEFGRRNYSPSMARWTTRDPIREDGGVNLYAFVENDPIDFTDPWGLSGLGVGLGLLNDAFSTTRHSGKNYDDSAGICDYKNSKRHSGFDKLKDALKKAIGQGWGGMVDGVGGNTSPPEGPSVAEARG